jgi:hypothetical protein
VDHTLEEFGDALRCVVAALRESNIRFVLGGSLAAWARGGPVTQNDLDLILKPSDAELALRALEDAGMRTERPPEEWLFKAWHGDVLIDLIFQPAGLEVTDEVLDRADLISVFAVAVPVLPIEDVLATKLNALDEHALNYSQVLAIARAVREQIDWSRLRALTAASPYAQPFFGLVEQLGIAPGPTGAANPRPGKRVRVLPDPAG